MMDKSPKAIFYLGNSENSFSIRIITVIKQLVAYAVLKRLFFFVHCQLL